jgi:hypothetical protein
VSDAWNRAQNYRDLAEECRRLASGTLSSQMKKRYLVMARDYILLADVEEQAHGRRASAPFQKKLGTLEPLL